MNLPADVAEAVCQAAGKELADRMAASMEDLQLFTLSEVAGMLKISTQSARRLVRNYVELGEASRRITPATLRQLIADRAISI